MEPNAQLESSERIGRPFRVWRNLILLILIVMIGSAVVMLTKYHVPDPSYRGKRLSTILLAVNPSGFSRYSRQRIVYGGAGPDVELAREALDGLGPKAVPLVQHWLHSEQPNWMVRLATKYPKSRWIPQTWRVDLREKALLAAMLSPTVGRGVFEDVFICLTNTPLSALAQGAIAEIVETNPGIFARSAQIEREGFVRQILVMQRELIQPTGYYVRPAGASPRRNTSIDLMSLQHVLDVLDAHYSIRSLVILERGEEPAKVGAAKRVIEDPVMARRALPLLIKNLQSSNRSVIEACANSLATYGPAASNALPYLSNYLSHPKAYVSGAASNAIARITAPVSSTAAPTSSIANLPP